MSAEQQTMVRDMAQLRARARDRLRSEPIPAGVDLKVWAGMGSGRTCLVCNTPIREGNPEYELEFRSRAHGELSVRTAHFHIECHAAWEIERLRSADGQ